MDKRRRRMKKGFIKVVSFVFCLIFIFNLTACQKGKDINALSEVWAVSASEKVLSDKYADEYAASRLEKIRIDAVRNEYENGQIIVTAKEDLSFTVEISDLVKNDDNTKVISKSNFKVYTEMYIFVGLEVSGSAADFVFCRAVHYCRVWKVTPEIDQFPVDVFGV